ncbi:Iron-regulated protein A precursor [Vibrio harveyi]|uniref:imelysin family protein n=1 Tax=Vibrio harveyi TaxID=669 RepID=UPI000DF3B34C|nr:imelysin family protein [Vibrio harveyi]EKO3822768.1 iron-regulated protein A [Vibrio harveyi]EKO3846558.1 iron-regulated protein A [Vibrio harveyi]MCG9237105.1 iron-regulated protein A [Vibrio harveyi]MCG9585610.1 iron-regulated protein A [Vibrio harveyi]MCQ9076111.1 iron-regulated protein A [Vibrio harveyi]
MKKTLLVSAIAATLSLAGCQSTNGSSSVEPESTSHISQNVYEVEFNAAQAFVTQTTKLEQSLTEYCASQMKGDAQIKQQWHQTMLAWMALQGQERGPATALEQSWNVQFWPDKKNTTGRKMSVLTKSDQIWSAEDISTQSVTVQGLGALEWLLYDKASSLSTNSNTCATSVAIAENLNNKASIIADSWAQNPWKSLDMTEWESEYISLLSNQLEYSMKKLSRPLAKIGKPRPYFSESWRSQTSLSNLKANLEALQALYLANGSGLDALLREQGHSELADRVVHQFDMALDTWPEDKSLFAALQTKDGYRMVLAQYNKLEQLKYLIHEEVAIELGVVIGFNATDGD